MLERLVCLDDIWAAIDEGEINLQDEELPGRHPSIRDIFLYVESLR